MPSALASRGLLIVDFLAVDEDLAGVALVGAGQDLDQRRLAGAVVAEQAHHLAGIEIDAGMVDGLDAAEGDRDVAHLDQRGAAVRRGPVAGAGFLGVHACLPYFTRRR